MLNLPFFYTEELLPEMEKLTLGEETSRHIVQVLRMNQEEKIRLTDGKGKLVTGKIINDHKKHCTVELQDPQFISRPARKISIAISLLKNAARLEWFLEATEIGVGEIIPMICGRTEKEKFKPDRLKNILVSSMLQSQQCWLPELSSPQLYDSVVTEAQQDQKFIAHCIAGKKGNLSDLVNNSLLSHLILIGPEGDFTNEEVELAITHHFIPVSLGNTRLRTETAGLVAATWLMTD